MKMPALLAAAALTAGPAVAQPVSQPPRYTFSLACEGSLPLLCEVFAQTDLVAA